MPGIAGIISKNSSENVVPMLERMVASMMHESFYISGSYFNELLQMAAGWVSLDSQGGSGFAVWNEAHDVCLILSGQTFGDDPQSTEAARIVELYQTVGISFLEELNGWFSGLLIDLRQRKLVLFNDRYGMGRIYYHENGEGFFYSSEAKSLLNILPPLRRIDEQALGEWFSCGCPLQNRTLFEGIALVPPGSAWTFPSGGRVEKRCYFKPQSWEQQPILEPSEYEERLQEIFPRILKGYFSGNSAVAMSLTGGLDGRMIMAWSPCGEGELPCYTFNGPIRDCADVKIARQIASLCHEPHSTIQVGDDFLDQFAELAARTVYLSDGAMDVTGAAELYVNRVAREIAPIRLTGNYGSEILRRHIAFKPRALSKEIFAPDLLLQASEAARTYSEEARGNPLSFIAFKQVPWHHYSRLAIEKSQLTLRSPFLDNELVALAFQAPPESATALGPSLRLIAAGNPSLARVPTDRGVTYPPSWRFLNKLQRSFHDGMARGEYAYDYGMPDWMARVDRAIAPLRLERFFLGRQKFCHFRSWYRDQLSEYVKEVLLDPNACVKDYLTGSPERIITAHLKGTHNSTVLISKLLSLELLHQLLIQKTGLSDGCNRPSSSLPLVGFAPA